MYKSVVLDVGEPVLRLLCEAITVLASTRTLTADELAMQQELAEVAQLCRDEPNVTAGSTTLQ